jgi:hypothetical protein
MGYDTFFLIWLIAAVVILILFDILPYVSRWFK